MRKFFNFILLFACQAVLFSSCVPGRDGIDGRDGRDGLGQLKTVVINVAANQWQYSDMDNNNYFFATVDMPEITKDVFKNGVVKMYRSYNIDAPGATQIELPYVRHNEYPYTDTYGQQQWGFYTETIDYQFGVGNLTIFYTASDFDYELDTTWAPEAMQFRCVVMY